MRTFVQIYKNACDAVESPENPEIIKNIKSENEWMLQ